MNIDKYDIIEELNTKNKLSICNFIDIEINQLLKDEKIELYFEIEKVDLFDLLNLTLRNLLYLRSKYKNEYKYLEIKRKYNRYADEDYQYIFVGKRLENEDEKNNRIKVVEQLKKEKLQESKLKEKKEYESFLKLKEKFEKKEG